MADPGKDQVPPPGSPDVDTPAAPPAATIDADARRRAEAFATHVEPEIDVLLRVARTLTGSWADGEDVVQETLIRAYRAMDSFDGRHPRAWLLTILRRTHLNSVRRTRPVLIEDQSLERRRPAFGQSASAASAEDVVGEAHLDDEVE
ncbi:RNA polymerase sigma factor, partial [Nocardioides sp.]|uniref:RNA polymerase sigma factor n=1 Tax=Nocardioides sp. TaxID=35761 RepID=UPI002B277B98